MHFKVSLDGKDKDPCSTLTLPENLYVDWDEIIKLDNAGKLGTQVRLLQGNTDVEIPEIALGSDKAKTILQFNLNGRAIVVPVHARYPLLKEQAVSFLEAGVTESTLMSSYHSCDSMCRSSCTLCLTHLQKHPQMLTSRRIPPLYIYPRDPAIIRVLSDVST